MAKSNLPGMPEFPDALIPALEQALAAKGPSYVPRTHHMRDGKPRFINRLMLETSPYLLQHAHNPVNWYAWGDEAFDDAARLRRPVFLSVGYSTCHWCHVMEGESFEDEAIAAFLNENYVCIKVDREERPDVDAIYMNAVQALTRSGGWPMSVFLTPAREPFFGGTYFPPRDGDRGARMGFLSILRELRKTYDREPERVQQAADALLEAIRKDLEGPYTTVPNTNLPARGVISAVADYFKRAFDPVHGGVRRAPKFPSNVPVRLLLREHAYNGDGEALNVATVTLAKMAAGGLYDQVGGGFHRYSVDERWLVPHFEKMLYDNALLVMAYVEAYQVTRNPTFARIVRETLDYVLREMTSPEGGFYSATDADSEGEEGRFFVWSHSEIRQVLGAEADRFMRHYGVTEAGNFEGHNILFVERENEAETVDLAAARRRLYDVRARRVPPLRDDKIIAAWNGLMISALAMGGRVLGEQRYVDAAAAAAGFVLARMSGEGRILRSYKDGRAQPYGFLDDQAFVAAGLIDLYEATFDQSWLAAALAVTEATERLFADEQRGGWYMTASDGERLLARERPNYDGAEPSGTSVALSNVLRLGTFTSDDRYRTIAERAFASLADVFAERPVAMTEALLALDYYTADVREIGFVWPAGTDRHAADRLLQVMRDTFVPNRVMAGAGEGADVAALGKLVPFMAERVGKDGLATVYVCKRGRCEVPTHDSLQFAAQLALRRPGDQPVAEDAHNAGRKT